MRLLFVVNDADFFVSHRLAIAVAAREQGAEVHVATPRGPGIARIEQVDLGHHEIPMSRRGINPLAETRSLLALVRLFRKVRPDVVHLVTMKPVIYGGIAARLCHVPSVVAAVAGLGYLSDSTEAGGRWLRRATLPLLRSALGHPKLRVIFQNPDDKRALVSMTALREEQTVLIPGSGIELDRYRYLSEPEPPIVVTLASRLLKPKGIAEFVSAARQLRERGRDVRFRIAGAVDPGNPLTVTEDQLDRWRSEGDVEILGHRADIPALFAASHIVCLPSYYGEGVPRVLLEAAACGRPVVTTDSAGCRDAIVDGETGLLVPPRDATALANAIDALASDEKMRRRMGASGRLLAEQEFDVRRVVERHLEIYAELFPGGAGRVGESVA